MLDTHMLPAPTPPTPLIHMLEYTDLDTTDTLLDTDTTWERDLLTPTLKLKLSHGWPTLPTDTHHTLVPTPVTVMPTLVLMPQLPMLMELMLTHTPPPTLVPTILARDLL